MDAIASPRIGVEPASPARKASGESISGITVRDRRFGRGSTPSRWWLNNDPIASAWHNALSGTFPRGEAFFIESVKAFREDAPPRLAAEIRAFVKQEINHTREHVAFNRLAADAGYDMDRVDARTRDLLELTDGRPAVGKLASTIALEHFTAMMAHEFLTNPRHFSQGDPEVVAMWRWHAVEEIEHKGVAFDTFLHATRDWPALTRYKVRCMVMLIVTYRFMTNRWRDTLDLLAQDGLTGARVKWRLLRYLFGTPGVLRRIFPSWLSYFKPGFHPWQHDDRALIGKYESEFADAVTDPA